MAEYHPKIFQRPELLDSSYVPADTSRIVGRDEELRKLENVVKPVAHGDPPRDAVIISKPGTGKTLCTKNVATRARAIAEKNDLELVVGYVNGSEDWTATQVANTLAEAANHHFDSPKSIPEKGYSRRGYFGIMCRLMKDADGFIAIIDEAEKLGDDASDILKLLHDSQVNGDLPHTATIAISNKRGFYNTLEARVQSRLQINDTELVFKPYDAGQLRDILWNRSDAFSNGVLDDDVIPLCAALSAQEHGDARKAIEMLKAAGDHAETRESETVAEEDVRAVYEEAATSRDRELISTSLEHAQYALFALAYLTKSKLPDSFRTSEIYKTYTAICEIEGRDAQRHQSVLRHLKEWAQIDLIESDVTGGGKGGGSYREHELKLDPDVVLACIQEDTFSEPVLDELH